MMMVFHKTYPIITRDSKVKDNIRNRFLKSLKMQKKSKKGLSDGYETHSKHLRGHQWGENTGRRLR